MVENGGIPLSWLIEVNSTGVREAFSLSKLHTLSITKYNPLFPVERWNSFFDSDSVAKAFGFDSKEYNFALNYFSVVNKKNSKADLLTFYTWNEDATPASLRGSRARDLQFLKTLNGKFSIMLGDDTKDVALNLNSANSYTDCALLLQEAIRKAGEPAPTTLDISKAEDTNFTITRSDGPASPTNVLTINLDDYEVTDDGSGHVTFDKRSKTLTGVSEGTTIFTFKAQEENKNEVTIIVSVACEASTLNITPSVESPFISKIFLNINTNADDYTFSSDNENASFDKSTHTITGATQGTTIFTFKAKYGDASEVSKNVNVDVAATTLALTATIPTMRFKRAAVNPELPAFTNADVIYSSLTGGFIIKSGISGSDSKISFLMPPSSDIDISSSLGLSENENAIIISGYDLMSFNEILLNINSVNGNYYVIDTTFMLNETEQLELSEFIDKSNDRFLGVINTNDDNIIKNDNALDTLTGYNGILVNLYKNDNPYGFSSGIISSIDYAQEAGNLNIAFNDATKFEDIAIDTKEELNYLELNKANSILKFGQMGQSQVWYGLGNVLGTKTNSTNVYIANSYLMFSLQYAFANLLNTQSFIGLRGTFNNGLMINAASDVFSRAVLSGIVVTGATLTDIERQVVISVFGSESSNALKQIEAAGFYIKIGDVDISKQTLNIITAYVANKNLKRIIVNNYILGA